MTKQQIVTLIGVISKVKEIADAEYDGKVYDNILAIFNKLQTREKRVLLKGLINICFVVEDKILVSTDDLIEVKEAISDTKLVCETAYSVEQNNKDEIALQLIKLKKLMTLGLVLFLLLILVVLLGYQSNMIDMLSNLFSLLAGFIN